MGRVLGSNQAISHSEIAYLSQDILETIFSALYQAIGTDIKPCANITNVKWILKIDMIKCVLNLYHYFQKMGKTLVSIPVDIYVKFNAILGS